MIATWQAKNFGVLTTGSEINQFSRITANIFQITVPKTGHTFHHSRRQRANRQNPCGQSDQPIKETLEN